MLRTPAEVVADELMIEDRFTYHPPQGDQQERYQRITEHAKLLAKVICDAVPAGRERALALTHLQTARMWANCGIAMEARLPPESPPLPES